MLSGGTSGDVSYYHYDNVGSTIALSNNLGAVVDRISYGPYGTITYRQANFDTPYLFVGAHGVETDSNGLYYMRARYYNPRIGRFVNSDPIGFGGGMNWYAYAGNNPILLSDSMGLSGYGEDVGNNIAAEGRGVLKGAEALDVAIFSFLDHPVDTTVEALNGLKAASNGAVDNINRLWARELLGYDYQISQQSHQFRKALKDSITNFDFEDGGALAFNIVAGKALATVIGRLSAEGCFMAGTVISTPSGEVNIEDIKVGDVVYAYDFESGRVVERTVLDTPRNFTHLWVKLYFGNDEVVATANHRIWVESEGDWVPAGLIKTGMAIRVQNGSSRTVSRVVSYEIRTPEITYNLEVDVDHNFYAGYVKALAHNGDGSYTNYHQSGKVYVGKGDAARAAESAAEKVAAYNDPLIKTDWTPANGDVDSFVQEALRLRAAGGPGGNTYNKINSPGEKILRAFGL